mmetsp:Transcript_45033/g.130282  ORF Transcript_45033/g.130282 Transcript_45033/m.130282 type:complete len:582 (-) Transcript_45033:149-1894(-)
MITYKRGSCGFVKLVQLEGSVFPFSFCVAMPCAIITAILRLSIERGWVQGLGDAEDSKSLLKDNTCWGGFVFLVGFLVVFRTSQAYARFWDGCTSTHQMRAEWFDACSALVAFCKHSKAGEERVMEFQHTLIRLFSVLHAVALADIEDTSSDDGCEVAAFKYPMVDPAGLSAESLMAVKDSDAKVELVFMWIQQLIVEHIETGVLHIPPPILSRAFQEIANGMVAFHEAIKISTIPFPFPYAQTCECLLIMHWVVTPLVVAQWVSTPWWGALFSFITVFIYWSLNAIATEIENPFGSDANDIDAEGMQAELNRHLLLLLEPQVATTPRLSQDLANAISLRDRDAAMYMSAKSDSLEDTWTEIQKRLVVSPHLPARSLRASRNSCGSHHLTLTGRVRVSRHSRQRKISGMSMMSKCESIAEAREEDDYPFDSHTMMDIHKGDNSAWRNHTNDAMSNWLTLRTSASPGAPTFVQEDGGRPAEPGLASQGFEGHNWAPDDEGKANDSRSARPRQAGLGAAMRRGDFSQADGEAESGGAGAGDRGNEATQSVSSATGPASRWLHASGVKAKNLQAASQQYNPPRG